MDLMAGLSEVFCRPFAACRVSYASTVQLLHFNLMAVLAIVFVSRAYICSVV